MQPTLDINSKSRFILALTASVTINSVIFLSVGSWAHGHSHPQVAALPPAILTLEELPESPLEPIQATPSPKPVATLSAPNSVSTPIPTLNTPPPKVMIDSHIDHDHAPALKIQSTQAVIDTRAPVLTARGSVSDPSIAPARSVDSVPQNPSPTATTTTEITPKAAPVAAPTPEPTPKPTPRPMPTPEPTPTPKPIAPAPTPRPSGPTREAEPSKQVQPTIPDTLKKAEFKSFVRVIVEVAADASFEVTLRTSSGNTEVDDRILDALKQWRWKAALKNGVSVASTQRFKFEIEVQ
jgi:hypothetical protein